MVHRVAVITNHSGSRLGPSETFIRAHQDGLPCDVLSLVGDPGRRCLDADAERFVPSRSFVPLAVRWGLRRVGMSSVAQQDRKAVADFLRKHRVDAVLAEYGQTAVSVLDACNDAGVPLIAHFHGWDVYGTYLRKKHADDYPRLFREAAAVIGVSTHMVAELLSLGADPERTHHNACGAALPPGEKARPDAAPPRFVMLGRLTEKKAPFVSIMAFAEVAREVPDASLVVVGDGPLWDASQQMVLAMGLEDRVDFVGSKPHAEALEIMRGCRCFLQHSVRAPSGDHEGTPVSVLEAMGLGLPVVSTRHGGIIDTVDDDRGVLVDEYDVSGMAKAMMRYAKDPALAQEHGTRGIAAVGEKWTNEKSNERLWGIIQGAAGLRNSSSIRE